MDKIPYESDMVWNFVDSSHENARSADRNNIEVRMSFVIPNESNIFNIKTGQSVKTGRLLNKAVNTQTLRFLRKPRSALAPSGSNNKTPATMVVGSGTGDTPATSTTKSL